MPVRRRCKKAFYSLINDRRLGEFELPEGSIVIGAGNRAEDAAIVRPLSSALINRMAHVSMRADTEKWLSWAANNNIHAAILEYIKVRPDHLWSKPPKHEEPFSTPRSWHMLSDIMQAWSKGALDEPIVRTLASGLLTPNHAQQFGAFFKQQASAYTLNAILKGEARWPDKPEERDVLYFMVQSFRAQLIKELPIENHKMGNEAQKLNLRAKDLIIQLARISLEMAQLVVTDDENGKALPNWFLMEISRDLPRLISR